MTTQLPPDPEQTTPSRRFTLRSTRPALALGALALSVFGLSQMTGTSAAFQDTAAATSGALTVSANVLPAVASMSAGNQGSGGTQWCELSWPHRGYPYIYRTEVYLNNTGSPVWTGDQDPGVSAPVGTIVKRGVGSDETTYHFTQTRSFTARVYTVNRLTGEKSTDWRGQQIRRRAAYFEGTCNGADQSISGASLTVGLDTFKAQTAPPNEGELATPTPTTQTAATPSITATPSTTSAATPSRSSQPTTTTSAPTQSAAPTSTTAPGITTAPSTTTAIPTPTSTTWTAPADTPLGAPQRSPSLGYSAKLVTSSGTSQTVLLIEDSSGDEVERIPVSASANFEWDSSTDTLWIVEGGQLYKASGSTWSKTSADPTSSDVPADIAALVE